MKPKLRRGRPSKQTAEILTTAVLDEATSLFLEQGYAVTSMEAIATAAGVGKHTLYRRFPDKATMFGAAMMRGASDIETAVDAHDARPPLQRLRTLTATVFDRAMRPEMVRFMRVIIAEGPRFPELAEMLREQGGSQAFVATKTLIREAQIAGALRAGDPEWLARSFLFLSIGMPLHRLLTGSAEYADPKTRTEHLERTWRLFIHGAGPAK